MIKRGLASRTRSITREFGVRARWLVLRTTPEWQHYRKAKSKVLGSRAKGTW